MKLKKDIGFWGVFCLATGTMISSGLFVLPVIVYPKAGPAVIVAYFLSALLMIPAMLSKLELATAMPKSGGDYFFIHRSLGALVGTFAGFASWYSLSLKSAFALLGIGLILEPIFFEASPQLIKLFSVLVVLLFTGLNILGVKVSSFFQSVLVIIILVILIYFIASGFDHLDIHRYVPFKPHGWQSVFTVVGMIFISYGGLTKIASVASEIKNPKINIPAGMIMSFIVTTILYVFSLFIVVGLLEPGEFGQTFNPLGLGASRYLGEFGFWMLSVAAILAFVTTGNAGLLSSSRIPLAMSEDNLIPSMFAKVNMRFQTPVISIVITSLFMISVIVFLDLEELVKVASTMMLILFALVNVSVILMRESKISSYKPSFKAPLYPWIQVSGIIVYLLLIIKMGVLPFFITLIFFVVSLLWYYIYSKSRNLKESALLHIVERITSKEIRSLVLPNELRDILFERDEIVEDKFDSLFKKANFIDVVKKTDKKGLYRLIAKAFSKKFKIPSDDILSLFKHEDNFDSITHEGLAISNIVIEGKAKFDMVVLRSRYGIDFENGEAPIHIIFALAGTKDQRNFFLQTLITIAQIVLNEEFIKNWKKATSIEDLKHMILLAERIRKSQI
ncbi:amino acid permease [Marinilabiliaceae bacterium JC017]|nr:amino acid permease [Marinilabiliaceae bacterium JC017]